MIYRRIFILIALLSLTSNFGAGQSTDELPTPVKNALAEYDKAWNSKNVSAVSNILASDYVYFSSTGGLTNRKSTLEFLATPEYKLSFVERSEIKLLSHNGQVAVVSSRWKGRGVYSGGEIDDDQRCGLVFVRQSKGWKLLSEHCAQIVTK